MQRLVAALGVVEKKKSSWSCLSLGQGALCSLLSSTQRGSLLYVSAWDFKIANRQEITQTSIHG